MTKNKRSTVKKTSHKKTAEKKLVSKDAKSTQKKKFSNAQSDMSLSALQFMAKSKGVPFGGLNKEQLIKRINENY